MNQIILDLPRETLLLLYLLLGVCAQMCFLDHPVAALCRRIVNRLAWLAPLVGFARA